MSEAITHYRQKGGVGIFMSVIFLQAGARTGPPGRYTRSWDGMTTSGRAAQPGLYFIRLSAGGIELTRKTVLAR
jgi:hypothetical protein